jgi:hypothetical protein
VFAAGGPRIIHESVTEESVVTLRLELPFDAGQMYGVTFSAPAHRPAWHLIRRLDFLRLPENVERDEAILRLMVVPDAPGTTDLVNGLDRLQQNASPVAAAGTGVAAGTYSGLAVAAQMALLNIEAKLRETFIDGTPLISFVRGVRHVAVDRVFLFFDPALKARMPSAGDFANAPGHGVPGAFPDLPAHPDSWKHTRYAEGNVQLSFSRDAVPLSGGGGSLAHSADVDIDLGRGLAHAAEWLENNVFKPGHKTDQSLVYGLLFAQGILPRYTLDPVDQATRALVPERVIRLPGPRARAKRVVAPAAAKRAAPKRARRPRSAATRGARGRKAAGKKTTRRSR